MLHRGVRGRQEGPRRGCRAREQDEQRQEQTRPDLRRSGRIGHRRHAHRATHQDPQRRRRVRPQVLLGSDAQGWPVPPRERLPEDHRRAKPIRADARVCRLLRHEGDASGRVQQGSVLRDARRAGGCDAAHPRHRARQAQGGQGRGRAQALEPFLRPLRRAVEGDGPLLSV